MAPKTAAATPARTTRSTRGQATPLPALDARPSHAYGARGRAKLGAQSSAPGTDFADTFDAGRERQSSIVAAGGNAEQEQEPPRRTTRASRRLSASQEAGTVPPEGPLRRALSPGRDATLVDSKAPYTRFSNITASRPLGPLFGPSRSGPAVPAPFAPVVATAPAEASPTSRYAPSSLRDLLIAAVLFAGILVAIFLAPVPALLVKHREDFLVRTMFNGRPEDWMPVQQSAINKWMHGRVAKLEATVEDLSRRTGLLEESIVALRNELPDYLVVRRDSEGWQIPSDFWNAMAEHMARGNDGASLWDAFLEGNKARVDMLLERVSVGGDAPPGEIPYDIVTRETFSELIAENNAVMQQEFASLLQDAQRSTLNRAYDIARNVSTDTIKGSPTYKMASMQIQALGYANYIKNAHDQMQSTNWFSPGLGARVDPKTTSPTMDKNAPSILPWLFTKVFGYPPRLPPIAALQEWNEAGQCWCAAPSAAGKAQITVLTPEPIHPHTLVIEHVPAKATLDISTAPKEIELWAELATVEEAIAMTADIEAAKHPLSQNECGEAPNPRSVCIASGTYEVHHDNWVQTFRTFVDTRFLGLTSNKFTVRVKTNWGQDWTCLYRLRLTGERVTPIQQVA